MQYPNKRHIVTLAAALIISLLSFGCGVGRSNSNSTNAGAPLPPAPPNAKKHSVYAVFPPVTPSDSNYNAFNTYVLPNSSVAGVVVGMPWNQIESNTVPGTYNFNGFDANVQHFLQAGKIVNIIVEPVKEGGVNTFTPTYVFGADWASSCCNTTPLDVVTCNSFSGNGAPDTGMPVV